MEKSKVAGKFAKHQERMRGKNWSCVGSGRSRISFSGIYRHPVGTSRSQCFSLTLFLSFRHEWKTSKKISVRTCRVLTDIEDLLTGSPISGKLGKPRNTLMVLLFYIIRLASLGKSRRQKPSQVPVDFEDNKLLLADQVFSRSEFQGFYQVRTQRSQEIPEANL